MKLAAVGNVLAPAVLLLEERGFRLTVVHGATSTAWSAQRGDLELIADDPLQLLGLADLVGARGAAWRATDSDIEDVLARFGLVK